MLLSFRCECIGEFGPDELALVLCHVPGEQLFSLPRKLLTALDSVHKFYFKSIKSKMIKPVKLSKYFWNSDHNIAHLLFGYFVLRMNKSLSECIDRFEVHWAVMFKDPSHLL